MSREGVVSISYLVNSGEFNSKMADMKKNLQLLQTECKNAAKEINLYGGSYLLDFYGEEEIKEKCLKILYKMDSKR